MNHYFLSLGSNINPEQNVPRMLRALSELSPIIDVSTVSETEPAGMDSNRSFLNLAVRVATILDGRQLKTVTNWIEGALGRDRSDPLSKHRDRVADIDVLFAVPAATRHITSRQLPTEPYVLPQLVELLQSLRYEVEAPPVFRPVGVRLLVNGLPFGDAPVSLHLGSRRPAAMRLGISAAGSSYSKQGAGGAAMNR